MKIKFNLARKNETTSVIIISIHYHNNRLQLSAGKSIEPRYWNFEKCRAKNGYARQAEINSHLNRLEAFIYDYYTKNEALSLPLTKENLKSKVIEFMTPLKKKSDNPNSLTATFEKWINDRKHTVKPRTILRHRVVLNHLKEYQKHTGNKLSFDNMNLDTANSIFIYLTKTKGLLNNSANTVITILKTFLNYAVREKLLNDLTYIKDFNLCSKNFTVKRESDSFSLSLDELKSIENLDLTGNKKLQKVRQLFLIQCYTGLRFSDLSSLKPTNFDMNAGILKVFTLKTDEIVELSITKPLRMILVELPGLQLPKISGQKYNDYLKELAKLACIDEPFPYVEYHGIERKDMVKPKCQLISSHTGRRTFITLSIEKGMLPERVMILTGHKSRAVFEKYVKASRKDALKQMADIWE